MNASRIPSWARLLSLAVGLAATSLPGEVADGGLVYSTDANFTVGEWNTHFTDIQKKADEDNVPLVVFWANPGCTYCKKLETALNTSEAYAWQKERGYYFVFGYGTSGDNGKAKSFSKHSSGQFPYVAVYWKQGLRGNTATTKVKFSGRSGKMTIKTGDLAAQFMDTVDYWLGDYEPPTVYVGGMFTWTETAGNRLEAEDGTTTVSFPLTRTEKAAAFATNHVLTVSTADGAILATQTVDWAVGASNQTVTLDLAGIRAAAGEAFATNGAALTLAVRATADGEAQDTRTITFIERENAAGNPLWIGERTTETLAFGEWTMDLDAATNKVAAAEGNAYTLVSVQGSLWCPDCANAERNFLDVADETGANRFRAWAAEKNVALVSIDIANFKPDTTVAAPTLLSRTAAESTLARAKEWPASGADAALTNKMLRSGLGYLTRKGVTDEAAAAALAANRARVAAPGGFFRSALDTNQNRTGVPIFVLLRKDGTVAARLTRFAAVSPMADLQDKWNDVIKRFDEMIALATPENQHADAGEIVNDAPGAGATAFAANGGTARGEISHTDFRDVFRLDGVGGNALQKVTVTGTTGAEVTLSFLTLDTNGVRTVVGTPVTGALTAEGFSIENEFTAAGTYYVEVAGASITNAAFAVDSEATMNFHPFTLAGAVVLVPQEARAAATAPTGSKTVTMRLEKGREYRIEGLNVSALGDTLTARDAADPYCIFYTANVSGDVPLTCAYAGGTVTYSLWNAGTVGFVETARTVAENVGTVTVKVRRAGGSSGRLAVDAAFDAAATTLYNSDGAPRFSCPTQRLEWAEGEMDDKAVTITVLDDRRFDGTGALALTLTRVDSDDADGDAAITAGTFTLTVTDDDTQSAGKAAFTGAEPYFARAKTVYVREGDAATVKVGRLEASDGSVTVRVKSSVATATLGGDVTAEGVVAWGNHRAETKSVTVAGLAAGKTATLTLVGATDGLKILSASNGVKVVAVAANAPAFATDAAKVALTRYVASSNLYALASVPEGATAVSFTKISGALPAGLKATYDKAANALAVAGAPTAKAGVYSAVYQVSAKVGGRTMPGLTLALAFTVTDLAAAGADGAAAANPALTTARTFRDLAVIDEANKCLAGTLQLTIPTTGRVSAKWLGADGTTSFSAKSWSAVDTDGTTVVAELAGARSMATLTVRASADGAVTAMIIDGEETYTAATDGKQWSKTASAKAWAGQYTVALRHAECLDETVEGLAPRGHGYLTFKMTTATAYNAGRVTWAGLLPNGTAVSGSSTLGSVHARKATTTDAETSDAVTADWAMLPVFKATTTDVLSVYADICGNAEELGVRRGVYAVEGIDAGWGHEERIEDVADWTVRFDVYGGYYDPKEDLAGCCTDYYETTDLSMELALADLGEWLSVGAPGEIDPVDVSVGTASLTLAADDNPANVRLSFNRSTGVVSGSFRLPYTTEAGVEKTLAAKFKGVVIVGWGEGCGCADTDETVFLPFVNGAYYVSDKVKYTLNGRERPLTVKRGGAVTAE